MDQNKRALVISYILAILCPCSFALNPALDISQYGHTAWTIRDGFFTGSIHSMVQTHDGYLMLGTEFGILRFDGIRKTVWEPPQGERLPGTNVRKLVAARDGTLWIGTAQGLVSWKNGKLTHYPELAGQQVFTMLEDRDGILWAGTFGIPAGKLCWVSGGTVKCYGADGSLGQSVNSLYEDNQGRVWSGGMSGLWQFKPGVPKRVPIPRFIDSDQALGADDDGSGLLLISDRLRRLANGTIDEYRLPALRGAFTPLCMLRDRGGALWIGTLDRGLLHVFRGRTDVFSESDGLSGNHVLSLFEDSEGNVWVSTTEGLDRFRGFAIPSISIKQGLSSLSTMTSLAAQDGSIWISTGNGLNRWKDGEVTIWRAPELHAPAVSNDVYVGHKVREIADWGLADNEVGSLFEDDQRRIWVTAFRGISRFEKGRFVRVRGVPGGYVNVITGDGTGGAWIADEDRGLYHVVDDQVAERFPWSALGHGTASSMIRDPVRKGLWLGFFQGGVVYFKNGEAVASYGSKQGLGSGRVMDVRLDADGVLYAATEGGLSRISDGHVLTLTKANGLPCDGVHWSVEDSAHFFWLYSPCGLIRVARAEVQAWAAHPDHTIQSTVFDASDGVRLKALLTGYTPRVSQSRDGKIWFALLHGVSAIDPRNLPHDTEAPPVHIEQVTADRKVYWQNAPGSWPANFELPALSRDVVIDYTALRFIAPEKVRFKYKLESYDRDWQDAGYRRQAFYSSLPPRSYRFRVIACNNSGVWNEAGDSLEFAIAPAYYQTAWFHASTVAAFLAALWGLYRLRLYQINREFNAQLEGRVEERLRVAREFHDTLLQSFQGLIPVFQTARNLLPLQAGRAAEILDDGLTEAANAIVEGRNAIQNLRASRLMDRDLESLLNAAGRDLLARTADAERTDPAFRVIVEGTQQPLAALIQDEVYRIGLEMLRNAFRHAHAALIEVEIRYDSAAFRLRIRDDGKGIDSTILKESPALGHWGLAGMNERAKQMGGRLRIWSESGAGTEAELIVPARIAYATFSGNRGWWGRLARRLQASAPNREAR